MNYFTNSKMKATGFFLPYTGDKYSLKSTGCGIYIIKYLGKIVYVGMARKDVRNTLYRHFQQWTDRRANYNKKMQPYERITYNGKNREDFLIKVIFCKGVIECEIMEQLLIKKLKPRDNSLKLYLYSQEEFNRAETKISEADQWKSNFEKNRFKFGVSIILRILHVLLTAERHKTN